MSLQRKVIPAAFTSGMDTSKDPKLVAGGFLKLQDCAMPRAGVISVRNGSANMFGTPAAVSETAIASYKNKPVLMEHHVKMLEGTMAAGSLQTMDTMERWKATCHAAKPSTSRGAQPYQVEVIEIGDIRCWKWVRYNSVGGTWDLHISTYNRHSGRLLHAFVGVTTAYNAFCPRLVKNTDSTRLTCFYIYVTRLYYHEINVTTGAVAAATSTGVTPVSNNLPVDVVYVNESTAIVAMGGISDLFISAVNVQAGTDSFVTVGTTGQIEGVCCWKRTGAAEAIIGWFDDTTLEVSVQMRLSDLSLTMATQVVSTLASGAAWAMAGVSKDSANQVLMWTEITAAQPATRYSEFDVPGFSASTDVSLSRKALLASKPFYDNDGLYVWLTHRASKCAFLYVGGLPCAKYKAEQIETYDGATPVATYFVPVVTASPDDSGAYETALREYCKHPNSTVGDTALPVMVRLTRPTRLQAIEAQDALLIPGSIPYLFDGTELVEQGYLHTPETPTGVAAGSGGNLSAGVYRLAITYRWIDGWGRLHESAPSGQATVTAVASDVITWTFQHLMHTHRANVQICLWRSKANGIQLYLRASYSNSKATDSNTLADGVADSTLTGAEEMYTRGGAILENTAPPQYHVQCMHQSRHVVVDDENPSTRAYYSKVCGPGLAVEHSQFMVVVVPEEGGEITALASDIDRLFVFKATRAYVFTGEGAAISGGGLGYQGPILVSDSHGAQHEKAVIVADGGPIVVGYDRVFQINRSLQISPVGDPVTYYTDPSSPGAVTIKAIVHQPKQGLVVVFTSGAALVYNTEYKIWFIYDRHDAKDAVLIDDLLCFIYATTNYVRYELTTAWTDAGAAVVPTIETGRFEFGGLGVVQLVDDVLLHMYSLAAHTLNVEMQYDDDPYWQDHQGIPSSGVTDFGHEQFLGAGSSAYQDQAYIMDAEVGRDECSSLRLKIYPSDHTGAARCFEIVGLSFRVAVAGTLRMLGAAREGAP